MATSWIAPPITRFDGLPADAPPRAIAPKPRVLSNPLVRFVLFMVAYGLGSLLVMGLGVAITGRQPTSDLDPMVPLMTISAALIGYLVLVLLVEGRRPPFELDPRRVFGLVVGIGLGASLFLLVFALIMALGGFQVVGPNTPHWPTWWAMVLFVGAGAGIGEELLFRGVLFRLLEDVVGSWVTIVVTGSLFAVAHIANPDATVQGVLGIVAAGLVFGLLYTTTRNLWLMFGFHGAWNIVQGPIMGVIVSGTGDPDGLLTVTPAGSDLISGGIFGAEASVVTVVVLFLLAASLGWYAIRHGQIVAPMWTRRARQRAALAEGVRPDAASLDDKQRKALAAAAVTSG